MTTIYLVTNQVNNKHYVGQTRQLVKKRWSRHTLDARKGLDLRFYRAIRKYGASAFYVEEIAVVDDQREASRLEKFWIGLLRATDPEFGYNSTYGGEGGKMTAEASAKKSADCKAWWTPERRKRVGESRKGKLVGSRNPMFGKSSWTGKNHSESTKQKISISRKQLFSDPEFKKKMAEANVGKHHTDEGKQNIAQAMAGNQYRKGIPHSPESKAKISRGMEKAYDEGRHARIGSSKQPLTTS